MIHVGIIGLGRVLDYHLPDLLELKDCFRIAAVFDTSEKQTALVAEKLGAVACKSYEDMLADKSIELVLVLTPPLLHCQNTVMALKAGKHVMVEKPMALTSAECEKMIEAAKKNNRVLTVHHNHRFSGFYHYATFEKLLAENAIGRPYNYTVRLLSSWGGYEGSPNYTKNWECKKEYGGGTILSWGPHIFDMLLHIIKANPISVYSVMNSEGWEFDGDSYSNTIVKFANGTTAQVEICYTSSHDFKTFYVQGEKGVLRHFGKEMLDEGETRIELEAGREKKVEPVRVADHCFYSNLYNAIREGEEILIDPNDVLVEIKIIEATMKSAEANQVILL